MTLVYLATFYIWKKNMLASLQRQKIQMVANKQYTISSLGGSRVVFVRFVMRLVTFFKFSNILRIRTSVISHVTLKSSVSCFTRIAACYV